MWDKLWEAIQKYGGSARDARIGAVGADQVRELYKSNKQEDKELAKELNDRYLAANAAGIAGGTTAASALTAGVVPTLVSEAGGAAGSYIGNKAGSYLDEKLGTQWIAPTLSIVGGLGGGIAGYKTLKPSYNYLAKNGVIGYKDVPEGMITLPKGNTADDDRYVILRDMLYKEFKDSNKAVHVSPNPISTSRNVNKAAAHTAGTKYVPGNSNVSVVTQNGDNKVWFWEGDLYRNRPMTDQTIIQIPKSYSKGNTRQVGATYVDDVDLTDPSVKIFQYDPVAKTYGRTIVTNQPSIARSGKTSYKFYEQPSKLSDAEKLGIPKGERNFRDATTNTDYWGYLQWNNAYNDAINSRNADLVNRLRTLHFKKKAIGNQIELNGEPMIGYHGTSNYFTEFNHDKTGMLDPGYYSVGFYHTPDYDTAYGYAMGRGGKRVMKNYLYSKNPIRTTMDDDSILGKHLNNNDGVIVKLGSDDVVLLDDNIQYDPNEITELVVPRSSQIKSANGITYDNNGKLIPIVKRDNFKNPDIRYQQGGKLNNKLTK